MTTAIRPLVDADYPSWLPLWHRYLAYNGSTPNEITGSTWTRLMDENEPVHALGAFQDNQLLGIAQYVFHRHTWWTEDVCLLVDVFASETIRNQGIGTALVGAVFERARAAGSRCVWGITMTNNAGARAIYDRVAERLDQAVYSKIL